ncbi:MAG: helix-turn-helix domain-containing protein [Flavobacteriaceae bacterium]|nr:helix-turn-helix domain-containing protein [Flavobacteriaceae bacterium]
MKEMIGNKIRKVRELKGYNQEYMALKLNISQRAYSKLERNETKLNWNRINDVSKILEIDPLDLVSFDENLIFNNCTQSGKFKNFYNNFPEELKKQYDLRIEEMKSEINFLRSLLDGNSK